MPKHGFTRMFENSSISDIKIMLNAVIGLEDAIPHRNNFTGPVDEFLIFDSGNCPYRCLELNMER